MLIMCSSLRTWIILSRLCVPLVGMWHPAMRRFFRVRLTSALFQGIGEWELYIICTVWVNICTLWVNYSKGRLSKVQVRYFTRPIKLIKSTPWRNCVYSTWSLLAKSPWFPVPHSKKSLPIPLDKSPLDNPHPHPQGPHPHPDWNTLVNP